MRSLAVDLPGRSGSGLETRMNQALLRQNCSCTGSVRAISLGSSLGAQPIKQLLPLLLALALALRRMSSTRFHADIRNLLTLTIVPAMLAAGRHPSSLPAFLMASVLAAAVKKLKTVTARHWHGSSAGRRERTSTRLPVPQQHPPPHPAAASALPLWRRPWQLRTSFLWPVAEAFHRLTSMHSPPQHRPPRGWSAAVAAPTRRTGTLPTPRQWPPGCSTPRRRRVSRHLPGQPLGVACERAREMGVQVVAGGHFSI
mmetsp:Transcript_126242/g.315611  ORF Transcript_126242/g.315611 Transcript_126242/m.315611 type:complete len:256 (+) Transcript_126242:469-1236(+)